MPAARAGVQPSAQPDRRWRSGWAFAGIWLVYLVPAVVDAWRLPSIGGRVVGLLDVVAFAALYMYAFYTVRGTIWRGGGVSWQHRTSFLGSEVGLALIACIVVGRSGLATTVYLAVLCVLLLPPRGALVGVLLLMAAVEASGALVPGWPHDHSLTLSIFLAGLAVWGISQVVARNAQLAAAQSQIAQLAVEQERSRMFRDLHDLLGHSLTVVAVKAELAGRLVDTDVEAARAEIADVERLARQALADVRSAVVGQREISLAGELRSARTALDAVGIEAELPRSIDSVPAERHEAFGWVVREAVTNVVRHSGARHCTITVGRDGVAVADDGAGPIMDDAGVSVTVQPPRGTGLAGLRARAEAAGAALTVGRAPEGGFLLRVGW